MTMPRELGHGRSTGGRTAVVAEESRIATAYARRVHNARYTWSDPAHVLSMQERVRAVLGLLRRHARAGLSEQRILEVGCGAGQWLRDFLKWVATPHRVVGIDLVQTRTDVLYSALSTLPFLRSHFRAAIWHGG